MKMEKLNVDKSKYPTIICEMFVGLSAIFSAVG